MRRFAFAAALLGLVRFAVAETPPSRYDTVEAAPVRTSIYVGTVTLTATPFIRHGGEYAADYRARVFPYFFYNEQGRLVVAVSDADLQALASGKPIDFRGQGIRSDGVIRRVDGRATPTGPDHGMLKVRIHVGRHLTLVFNTTYAFAGPAGAVTASAVRPSAER